MRSGLWIWNSSLFEKVLWVYFADRTQKFEFHVRVLDSDYKPYLSANSAIEPDDAGWYTFDLSNGDQCIFNVPQGGHYQVWEDPLGYTRILQNHHSNEDGIW